MGIVTSTEFESEISHVVTRTIDHGRGSGRTEVPSSLRKLIASESLSGASASELSEEFGISKSSISAYKNGATSTSSYHNPDKELKESNDGIKNEIRGKARTKLLEAIDSITSPDLQSAKLRDKAAVATAMSSVVKNMSDDGEFKVQNNVILYKPRMKEEDDYEVITVNE